MTVSIPSAGGVPGISGPPDWLSGGAGQDFRLDDVRWRGATRVDFAAGAAHNVFFRALHSNQSGQEFIYMTLRAGFVPEMNTSRDFVYIGLRKHATGDAIAIKIQAHDSSFSNAGPPPMGPPVGPFTVQVKVSPGGGAWDAPLDPTMNPAWISANTRVWLQDDTVPGDEGNFRWGVQIRIPANLGGGILNTNGPELATDFDMWYLIRGSVMGNPTILAEYRTDGLNTSAFDLTNGNYPLPSGIWDRFQLTSGPASFGGVTIMGNGQNDVVVQNSGGTGTTIKSGALNTFIARPRNYRTPGNDINSGEIAATFRIANWGSVGGNPNQVNWASGTWDFVDPLNPNPVASTALIQTLPAGNNPPATSPIAQPVTMTLGPNKSIHQCILVNLSSTGPAMNFLQDSVFRNMDYAVASTEERDAEINTIGLPKDDAPDPRTVYLAIEKINMPANTPGANAGKFLSTNMSSVVRKGGPLAEKLRKVLEILRNIDRQTEDPKQRLQILITVLTDAGLSDDELDQVFPTFRIHVYHDTGERIEEDGEKKPVLRAQSSFGLYMYHEDDLEGWQTSIQGAQRVSGNVYQMPVPKDGTAKIKVRVQAVEKGQDRLPEDPIVKPGFDSTQPGYEDRKGCLLALWKLLGLK
jgi:hypothetical protein